MTVLEIEDVTKTPVADALPPGEAAPPEETVAPATREVRDEYTRTLASLLNQLGVSLLVSTYQAGKVVAVGVAEGELTLSYHNFERATGLAVKPDAIAVGARAQVWFLRSVPDLARRVEPVGRHDACFLTRSSHFTGETRPTSWPGRETSCGSSTRRSAACARWTTGTVSCRAGGRRFSRRWRPRTAATSTGWPWPPTNRECQCPVT